jgi:hypothetical protein
MNGSLTKRARKFALGKRPTQEKTLPLRSAVAGLWNCPEDWQLVRNSVYQKLSEPSPSPRLSGGNFLLDGDGAHPWKAKQSAQLSFLRTIVNELHFQLQGASTRFDSGLIALSSECCGPGNPSSTRYFHSLAGLKWGDLHTPGLVWPRWSETVG